MKGGNTHEMQHRDNRQDRQSSYRTHCDCSWVLFEQLVGNYWPVANPYICYRAVWTVYPFWNIHVQNKGIDVSPTVGKNSFWSDHQGMQPGRAPPVHYTRFT